LKKQYIDHYLTAKGSSLRSFARPIVTFFPSTWTYARSTIIRNASLKPDHRASAPSASHRTGLLRQRNSDTYVHENFHTNHHRLLSRRIRHLDLLVNPLFLYLQLLLDRLNLVSKHHKHRRPISHRRNSLLLQDPHHCHFGRARLRHRRIVLDHIHPRELHGRSVELEWHVCGQCRSGGHDRSCVVVIRWQCDAINGYLAYELNTPRSEQRRFSNFYLPNSSMRNINPRSLRVYF
jgi:hypothetical protein